MTCPHVVKMLPLASAFDDEMHPSGHRSRTLYDFVDELCMTLVGDY